MTVERFILAAITTISIASVFYIPKDKYRLSFISFLSFQALSWITIIFLVQTGSIEFPVREFPRATNVGFLVNYIFLPALFVWSVLISQNMVSIIHKVINSFIFISLMVWFIYFISTYTQLENFIKGTFSSHIIRLYIEFIAYFIICNIYISWFTKKTKVLVTE
ncbi:MAG: hypothetical protein N3I35_02170 [Clostridia bacterium]|nr:hypothetical protein [Clostridia bacterium]